MKLQKCKQCPHAIYRKLENCDTDFYECYKMGRPINPELISAYCPLDTLELSMIDEYLQTQKTAKETMENMPIIDDPEISEALKDIGL